MGYGISTCVWQLFYTWCCFGILPVHAISLLLPANRRHASPAPCIFFSFYLNKKCAISSKLKDKKRAGKCVCVCACMYDIYFAIIAWLQLHTHRSVSVILVSILNELVRCETNLDSSSKFQQFRKLQIGKLPGSFGVSINGVHAIALHQVIITVIFFQEFIQETFDFAISICEEMFIINEMIWVLVFVSECIC